MTPASRAAVLVFSLVSIGHLLRLIFRVEVLVAGTTISLWVSVVGFIVPGAVAVALWRESRASRESRAA